MKNDSWVPSKNGLIYTLYNIFMIIKQIGPNINGLFMRYVSNERGNIKDA